VHLRVLRVSVVNKVLEFLLELGLPRLVGVVMALRIYLLALLTGAAHVTKIV